ncbi:hypothetical protein ACMFMG_002633 [Clarireedia jacksonii]
MFSKIIISTLIASTDVLAAPIIESPFSPAPPTPDQQISQLVTICYNKGMNDYDNIKFNFGFCVSNVGRLNQKVSSLNANGYNCTFYK